MREAVYQRARAALARQLTAVDPPLSPHEIEAQQQQLEDAVAAIEAEHPTTRGAEPEFVPFEDDEPARQEPPAPPPPPARREPPPVRQQPQMPRVSDFQSNGADEPQRRPARQRPADEAADEPAEPRVVPARPAAPREEHRERDWAEDPRAEHQPQPERKAPVRQEPQLGPRPVAAAPAAAAPADHDEPDEDEERVPGFLEEDETRVSRARLDRGAGDRTGRRSGYPDDDGEGRRSRAPALIALALLLLVVLGGGALLYAQRDALVGLFDSGDDATQQAAVETAVPTENQEVDAAGGKRPDRLTNGASPGDVAETDTAPEPVQQPAPPPSETSEPAPSEQSATIPNVIPPSSPQSGSESLVAQRAIFYEQGGEGTQGRATEGTIAWSEVEGQDGAPAIQANIEVPERNLQAVVTITKNDDSSLPASHLVEVQLVGVDSLGNGSVERVPALVLKPNEQARGQPLAGAAVPVTDSLFWIALSDDPEQVTRNLTLMREGSWFDLPVLFEGGKRALLTFEKGIPGDKVFETVLAEW